MASSAYGQQTALFVPRLRSAGHEVSILATSQGYAHRLADGTLLLPVVSDRFGNSIVAAHAKAMQADLVLTLVDPHVLDVNVYKNLPWCAWAPLDFETPTKATVSALSHAKWIWSPSKHGQAAYEKAGLKATWVPHGVDSIVFDIADRSESRSLLGATCGIEIPDDTFLVVAVAANRGTPSRKGFYEMMSAWKLFTDAHPTALLYLHTEPTGMGVGENIFDIMELVSLSRERVIFPPQYQLLCGALGPEHLAAAYNAADVYLSTSHGEGFGIPAIEGQLCGCPVIMPRNTAQVELCKSGVLVDAMRYLPFDGATEWQRPDVTVISKVLTLAAENEHDVTRKEIRERVFSYDIDAIFNDHFMPAIDWIASLKKEAAT